MKRLLPRLLALTLLGVWPASAQQADAPAQSFPASVSLVSLEVVVVGADGRPLPELAPEDFVVSVDGHARRVVSARFRNYPGTEPVVVPADDAPFSTNEGAFLERVVTVVADQESIGTGATQAMGQLGEQLLAALGPSDQVGLLTLPGPAVRVPHTTNRAQLRAAFGSVFGRPQAQAQRLDISDAMAFEGDPANWNQVTERLCPPSRATDWEEQQRRCIQDLEGEARFVAQSFRAEADATIGALRRLIESLGKLPGTKPLVFVSGGFADSGGSDMESLAREAAAAEVRLHVVMLDPGSQDASQRRLARRQGEDRRLRGDGPARLAGVAGAGFYQAVGSSEGAFARLAGELSGDYSLGFEPLPVDFDGKPHRVSVHVSRPDVTVRAPASITLRAPGKPDEILTTALQSRELRTELPLRVASYALQAPQGDGIRLVVSADLGRGEAPAALGVLYVLADSGGRVVASGQQRLASGRAVSSPAFVGEAVVPRGRYLLKLAALDQAGRVGSVRHPVRATLVDAPGVAAGDLILAPASRDLQRAPRPGVDVEIEAGALAAYLEVYAPDDARLESTAVAIEVGVPGQPETLVSVKASKRLVVAGRQAFQGRVDVGALPPGTYEARAVVSFPGGELRPLQRPFRITRPALALGEPKPLGFEDIAPAMPRFDPASVLRSEILQPALDQLQSRSRDASVALARQQLDAGSNADLSAAAEAAREPLAAAFLRGVAAYARSDYPAAAGQLRAALRAASDFMPAAIYLGACQAAQGRDLDAAGAWQTAMMTGDVGLALRRLLAEALLRGRDTEAALGHLQEARERWPDDGGLRRTEGLALAAQGRRAEALASLMPYADSHPEDLSVLYLTTRLLFEKFVEQPAGFAERERLQRYASSYVASGGPERLVVGRWIEFIQAR